MTFPPLGSRPSLSTDFNTSAGAARGVEPLVSAWLGGVLPLHHQASWYPVQDLNSQPSPCGGDALPLS